MTPGVQWVGTGIRPLISLSTMDQKWTIMKVPTLRLSKLNKEVVLTVRVIETTEWKIRRRLALWLFWLASRVLNCGFDVIDEEDEGIKL